MGSEKRRTRNVGGHCRRHHFWAFPGSTAQHKAGLIAVSKLDTHEDTCHPPPVPVLRRTGGTHIGLGYTETAEGCLAGMGRSEKPLNKVL